MKNTNNKILKLLPSPFGERVRPLAEGLGVRLRRSFFIVLIGTITLTVLPFSVPNLGSLSWKLSGRELRKSSRPLT